MEIKLAASILLEAGWELTSVGRDDQWYWKFGDGSYPGMICQVGSILILFIWSAGSYRPKDFDDFVRVARKPSDIARML